ncbi:KR domain-containing protein [Aspergillus unguis]
MSRGACNFVFLGRSGTDNPSAKALVSRLTDAGANVTVVRGDVSKADDVAAAVDACLKTGKPIGGVVQAAMGLHEALFTQMSNTAWHTGIDPKYQGTWNIHNALTEKNAESALDFFLLTSSVSGTVGTATEANYCAANSFLDSFAQWHRSQNKPCIAIGLGMISEVGYLHESPEIEALLLRKGIQPLNEDEFLQIVDFALCSEFNRQENDSPAKGHILTGLEPAGVRELSARGFDVSSHGVLVEPRAAVLSASLQAEQEIRESTSNTDSADSSSASTAAAAAAPWFKALCASLQSTYASECGSPSLESATLALLKKRFSSLILMPVEQINEGKSLSEFGMDSMIASEFRTWFWTAFRVGVPFLDIMSPRKSLGVLGEFVAGRVVS